MKKKLIASLFYILPQKGISALIGKMAKSTVSRPFISPYIALYGIQTDELEKPLSEYRHLTDFFTRKLKDGARKIDPRNDVFVSPVDGTVSSFGTIDDGTLIQAKGIPYDVATLLGDETQANKYKDGSYITVYLSPSDYHRIHMPYPGKNTHITYIPGRLFPVNEIGVTGVNGLFTKNERMVRYFDTSEGTFALVKVGAFIVGSVVADYPLQQIKRTGDGVEQEELAVPAFYDKGDELGYFEFGSTVILVFEKDKFTLRENLTEGQTLQMGEVIATKKTSE